MIAKDTVLIVSTSFPFSSDGSEAAGAFVADFVEELSKHTSTRVVGPGPTESVEDGDIPVWRFAAGNRPLSLLSPANPLHWTAILRTLRSLRRQVSAACADHRVKHIVALWVLPSGWAARAVAKAHDIDYSIWALGSDIWSLGKLPIVGGLLRKVGKDARNAFADGIQLSKDAEKLCHRPFEFLPSSRKLSGIRSLPVATNPPYRLLFLGRWHINKGIDLLLEALHLLDDDDWRKIKEVHIAGGGPMENLVHAKISMLRKAGRPIRLSGYLSKEAAEQALGETDRLLIPSRVESIPVVFSDALSFGIPVVAMCVGDLPHLLRNGGGWVTEGLSSENFLSSLRSSLQSHEPTDHAIELRQTFSLVSVCSHVNAISRSHQ